MPGVMQPKNGISKAVAFPVSFSRYSNCLLHSQDIRLQLAKLASLITLNIIRFFKINALKSCRFSIFFKFAVRNQMLIILKIMKNEI